MVPSFTGVSRALALAIAILVACASCARATEPGDEAIGTGGAPAGLASTSASDAAASTSVTGSSTASGGSPSWNGLPWSAEPCSEPTKFVYVVSAESSLYRYWPPTGQFSYIGDLTCDGQLIMPFSMAIDRHAIAWVETYGSEIYEIDLSNGNCTKSDYAEPRGEDRFPQFGMAFVSTPTPDEESLFLRGIFFSTDPNPQPDQRWLGRFDEAAATIEPVALGAGWDSDLTGTDGRLFAFQVPEDEPWAQLVEVDTSTAAPLSTTTLPGVQAPFDLAVAAWGGDFYFFSDDGVNPGTAVAHLETATGTISWAPGPLFPPRIVGAGVSTCAPVTPPQ